MTKSRRQQPGFACEECRRRKARCDRTRPKCGLCIETGTVCTVLDKKQPRGPKKGQLNAMRSQIASLQLQINRQLSSRTDSELDIFGQRTPEQNHDAEQAPGAVEFDSEDSRLGSLNDADMDLIGISPSAAEPGVTSTTIPAGPFSTSDTAPLNLGRTDWGLDWRKEDLGLYMDVSGQNLQLQPPGINMMDHNPFSSVEPTTLADNRDPILTDHMRADLDQVYFDRVHPVLPIIYRRHFFSWADQESPGLARVSLRLAMRLIAAAMSAPGHHFCDQLYAETCRLLQAHTVGSKDDLALEYIQAWLLVGYYELLRVGEHQAILTAGRCFRLVHMARLSDIDAPNPGELDLRQSSLDKITNEDVHRESFSLVEEKRRMFWLAFCLDRFLCSRNQYPLTLQDETANYLSQICTRLPAPEVNFQNNQHIRTSFLSEVISNPQHGPLPSPFAECIIIATLDGRCMAHRRSYATKQFYDGTGEVDNFWMHQRHLASAVEKHMQVLGTISSVHVDSSPLLLFVHMLAHSTVIKLGYTAQRASSAWRTVEQHGAAIDYERRAFVAVAEIVRLSRQVTSFSCLKGHPFLPDPLACAANFLTARSGSGAFDDEVQYLQRLLKDMQGVNSLARGYFD